MSFGVPGAVVAFWECWEGMGTMLGHTNSICWGCFSDGAVEDGFVPRWQARPVPSWLSSTASTCTFMALGRRQHLRGTTQGLAHDGIGASPGGSGPAGGLRCPWWGGQPPAGLESRAALEELPGPGKFPVCCPR